MENTGRTGAKLWHQVLQERPHGSPLHGAKGTVHCISHKNEILQQPRFQRTSALQCPAKTFERHTRHGCGGLQDKT
uniref:Uncharacterized protein n=1 Tax=Octopus bimaculoides TaxID=37653 RepID=A0A0L8IGD3_OCTBM